VTDGATDPAATKPTSSGRRVIHIPADAVPDRPLTPGEALEKLFMANADRGANAANDELVAALRQRAREIRALTARQ
jgi:hypothetical protein